MPHKRKYCGSLTTTLGRRCVARGGSNCSRRSKRSLCRSYGTTKKRKAAHPKRNAKGQFMKGSRTGSKKGAKKGHKRAPRKGTCKSLTKAELINVAAGLGMDTTLMPAMKKSQICHAMGSVPGGTAAWKAAALAKFPLQPLGVMGALRRPACNSLKMDDLRARCANVPGWNQAKCNQFRKKSTICHSLARGNKLVPGVKGWWTGPSPSFVYTGPAPPPLTSPSIIRARLRAQQLQGPYGQAYI